jgi:hypothetical protein
LEVAVGLLSKSSNKKIKSNIAASLIDRMAKTYVNRDTTSTTARVEASRRYALLALKCGGSVSRSDRNNLAYFCVIDHLLDDAATLLAIDQSDNEGIVPGEMNRETEVLFQYNRAVVHLKRGATAKAREGFARAATLSEISYEGASGAACLLRLSLTADGEFDFVEVWDVDVGVEARRALALL